MPTLMVFITLFCYQITHIFWASSTLCRILSTCGLAQTTFSVTFVSFLLLFLFFFFFKELRSAFINWHVFLRKQHGFFWFFFNHTSMLVSYIWFLAKKRGFNFPQWNTCSIWQVAQPMFKWKFLAFVLWCLKFINHYLMIARILLAMF